MRFDDFDARHYRTVDVRTGYGEWVSTYEDTVQDTMDIALLDDLVTPSWDETEHAVDLGCGTGRTAQWLRGNGVGKIDGVDLTPEMLALARTRGAHDNLVEADVIRTGLPSGTYDLISASLIDEHIADLDTLYAEAWRLARADATFAIVAFHPHFIMHAGMPTHYTSDSGEPVAITTHVHLLSDHVTSALGTGWRLAEMREGVIDDRWIAVKPKWEKFRNHPISAAFVWRKET
ncbi:class I SAM-dependent DNA methyltransferase [Parasphingorhabdus pacifica]